MLQPHFSHDLEIANHLSDYYKNECGITLLPYLRDENNHLQLLNVLEHFAQKIPVSSPLGIDRLVEMKALLDD